MEQSLQSIKGIGEKRAQQLDKLGVHTVDALLGYYPRDYCDYSKATPVHALVDGKVCAIRVRIAE